MELECREETCNQLVFDRYFDSEGQASPDELMDLVGEILDNARSAAEANDLQFNISIFVEELEKDKIVSITVKDESGGISKEDFSTIFSPGYSGKIRGFLNNFGIGLKKTLCIVQYHMNPETGCTEPKTNFYIKTATTEDIQNKQARIMYGPLTSVVNIKTIDDVSFEKAGTEVSIILDDDLYPLFKKLPMRGPGRPSFDRRIYRLHEQIGWAHGPALGIRGRITIYHKAFGRTDFSEEKIHPLGPVWRDSRDTRNPDQMGYRDLPITIPYMNTDYIFNYTYGILRTPTKVKNDAIRRNDGNKHIYPLTKYEKTPGSAGVDIIIGGSYGKRICRLSLNTVFETGSSKLEFESYHGVLTCPANLPTSCLHNIKKKMNDWNPIMQGLLDAIKSTEEITPETTCRSTPEKVLHTRLLPLLSDRGHVEHEYPVNNRMEGLGSRSPLKVDFMIETNSGHYEIIEVAKALDLEHIYKMDAYRKFIQLGLSDGIQWNMENGEMPHIKYILITPRPSDDFMLHYLEIYGFEFQPLSRFNINDSEIR